MEGLKVTGSVGSDEKLKFIINDLGFDADFDYMEELVADALKRLAPEMLDIYFDNVGGETLEAAIHRMRDFGRTGMQIPIAPHTDDKIHSLHDGYASACNQFRVAQSRNTICGRTKSTASRIFVNIFLNCLFIQEFIILDLELLGKYAPEFFVKMSVWLKEGKITKSESVMEGIENARQVFLSMFI